MKSLLKIAIAGAALSAVGSVNGQLTTTTIGDTISHEWAFGPASPVFNSVAVFPQFPWDPTEVQSITIELSISRTGGSISVDNDSATGGNVDFTHNVSTTLASALNLEGFGSALNPVSLTATQSVAVAGTSGDDIENYNNTGLGDFASFAPSAASTSDSTLVSSGLFSQYSSESPSNYSITIFNNQDISAVSNTGIAQLIVPSNVNGTLTITATRIPEPSTYAAIFGGLALAGAIYFRRRKAAK